MSWQWYVDGQAVSSLKSPTLTFTNSGFTHDSIYNIKLVAWDANGCVDSSLSKVRVHANMKLNWYALQGCMGDSIRFYNTTALKDSIAGWTWDFGDGSYDSTATPKHLYSQPGQYIVNLQATTINGCVFNLTDTVVNYPRPIAAYGFNTNCGRDSACVNQVVSLVGFFADASLWRKPGAVGMGHLQRWKH
ncbi:MAG: PKD domain-containing protein [Owenweeksia sp.]|nr:PKD domain-containing protein [Owenweeksia sp.]